MKQNYIIFLGLEGKNNFPCWSGTCVFRCMLWNHIGTRMHSSRIRTSRLLMYPGGGLHPEGGGLHPGGGGLHPGGGGLHPGEGGLHPGGLPRVCPRSTYGGVGRPPSSSLWTEWHTGVKILPCPKLRLRAVRMQKTLYKETMWKKPQGPLSAVNILIN